MCTLSFLPHGASMHSIAMNRDDAPSRADSGLIQKHLADDGTPWLAPQDPAALGTWIAVNRHGLTLCLLNQHPPGFRREGRVFRTRGEIIPFAIAATHAADAMARVRRALNPRDYPPFLLVAIGRELHTLASDGQVALAAAWPREARCFASSSHSEPEVIAARQLRFREFLTRAPRETLDQLHGSHEPEAGPLSFCMHREEARTLSLTQIEVRDHEVSLSHRAGAPCAQESRLTWIETLARPAQRE